MSNSVRDLKDIAEELQKKGEYTSCYDGRGFLWDIFESQDFKAGEQIRRIVRKDDVMH
jgi:hypothetical protein